MPAIPRRNAARYAAPHLPGPDLRAAEILGRSGLRDPAALRHGNGRGHVPHRDLPALASVPSRGRRPMCSPRAVPPTAATATTRSACSTTTSSRWSSNPRRWRSSICTSAACARWASTRWCTTCASSKTTGSRPTLGAWGLGWEVWLNGMEVTQFTYFQQVGGLDCRPVTGEITYGLERLAMYLQGVESIFDIVWADGPLGRVTYRDVYHQNEVEQSKYNFEVADTAVLLRRFDEHEAEFARLIEAKLALPAYEQVMKASHTFNLLDARKAISVTERQRYILRVRTMARAVAQAYYDSRESAGLSHVEERVGPVMNSAARDFLVELGTEELPPLALPELEAAFAEGIRKGLGEATLPHGELRSFATPRRLAVLVRDLAATQPAQSIKLKGPPVSAAFGKDGAPATGRAQVRGEMRRRGGRAHARDRRQGRIPVLRRQQARSEHREPAGRHRAAVARRSCRFRSACAGVHRAPSSCGPCTGWCCCTAASSFRRASSTPMPARPRAAIDSWRRENLAAGAAGGLRSHAARARQGDRGLRRAPRTDPRAGGRGWANRWAARR